MPDLKLYSNCYSTMDGSVLSEVTNVSINKDPKLNPVATMALGFAGVTLGAAMTEVTLQTAVPSADFEVNPDKFMQKGKVVEIGVVMAGRQMQAKMFITGAQYSAGVDQPSNLSITLIGPFTPWE